MLKAYSFTLIFLLNLGLAAQVVPGLDIIPQASFACTNTRSEYTGVTQSGTASYTWSAFPSKYVTISNPNAAAVYITFSKDLTYTVSLTASENGNTSTVNKIVPVFRSANASFNASLNSSGFPAELKLTNYSTGTLKNYWVFNDAPADSSTNTVKSYSTSGNYTVTLMALGQKGCNDESTYTFNISDFSSIELPNVFTPNRDEVNDVFKPITKGIDLLHAYIFNREGIMIHSWHKVNGFWDGRTTSGEVCQDGVYFVVIDAVGFDGKVHKHNGTVTLIR